MILFPLERKVVLRKEIFKNFMKETGYKLKMMSATENMADFLFSVGVILIIFISIPQRYYEKINSYLFYYRNLASLYPCLLNI